MKNQRDAHKIIQIKTILQTQHCQLWSNFKIKLKLNIGIEPWFFQMLRYGQLIWRSEYQKVDNGISNNVNEFYYFY